MPNYNTLQTYLESALATDDIDKAKRFVTGALKELSTIITTENEVTVVDVTLTREEKVYRWDCPGCEAANMFMIPPGASIPRVQCSKCEIEFPSKEV